MSYPRMLLTPTGRHTPTFPPVDDSWSRVTPAVITPSGWMGNWVLEPTVVHDGDGFHMIFTGHSGSPWTTSGFGYAHSTDGITWTDHGSIVLGQGASGQAGAVYQPELMKVGSTFYLFFGDSGHHLCVATSTDCISWTVVASNILSFPTNVIQINNSSTVLDGSTWKMIVEMEMTGNIYRLFYATSSDLLSWTIGNSGLPLASFTTNGGPFLWPKKRAGLWHMWTHGITHWTSPDLITWTKTLPDPVFASTGSGRDADAATDPSICVVNGTAYLYTAGQNNSTEVGDIWCATAPAKLIL